MITLLSPTRHRTRPVRHRDLRDVPRAANGGAKLAHLRERHIGVKHSYSSFSTFRRMRVLERARVVPMKVTIARAVVRDALDDVIVN